MKKTVLTLSIIFLFTYSCTKEEEKPAPEKDYGTYDPTYVDLNLRIPDTNKKHIPRIIEPQDNRTTEQGIKLGRELFYETLLSGDGTMSCGTCHNQGFVFSDNGKQFSEGIDGSIGTRNAQHIVNPGSRRNTMFWDGRANGLEDQAFGPVTNPIEMKHTWPDAVKSLNELEKYREMSFAAFGTPNLDSVLVAKAIAQFERTFISTNSKYDRWRRGEYQLTPEEAFGRELFNRDRTIFESGADCFHCHNEGNDFTDNAFHNNGLDEFATDLGRAKVTGDPFDNAKFKTPSLRNLEHSGPYMHDGRFKTIREVVDFYSEGLKDSPTIDPLMKNLATGGVQLTEMEKDALIAFLLTFTDPEFLNNPSFSDPNLP